MEKMNVAIIGSSGVVGRALLELLSEQQIPVTGYSRRPPDLHGAKHISLDLLDQSRCREVVQESLTDVTHLVYTALYEKPGLIAGWQDVDQMATNLTMLQNLMQPLLESKNSLRQVTLLQGTKAYGAHIRPMAVPGKERDPRVEHPNFYWLQEDYLRGLQVNADWHFTIWRPQIIFGHALGAPMNMIGVLGVYGALCRHRGLPLRYPGGPSGIMEAIDADLLARAIRFSFDNANCQNETFNITNGDVFTWENIWPALAEALGMETGEPRRDKLSTLCADETAWRAIVAQYELQEHSLKALVGDSIYYADALFNSDRNTAPPAALLSTVKLRQAGFADCIDTEDMMLKWFEKLRHLKILPPR